MPARSAGLLVTVPLLGYGVGLLFLVPLGDVFENRRLVLTLVGIEALCLLAISVIPHPVFFLAVSFVMGTAAAAVQLLVPYVTYIAPEAVRGQAVGKVVSGVMIGILVARPLSSLVAVAMPSYPPRGRKLRLKLAVRIAFPMPPNSRANRTTLRYTIAQRGTKNDTGFKIWFSMSTSVSSSNATRR
jgi:MFS family permease